MYACVCAYVCMWSVFFDMRECYIGTVSVCVCVGGEGGRVGGGGKLVGSGGGGGGEVGGEWESGVRGVWSGMEEVEGVGGGGGAVRM